MTRVEWILCDTSMKFHHGLAPGDDVTGEVAGAGRLVVDLGGGEHARPQLQIRHLAHKRLCGVETAAQSVLERRESQVSIRVF